MPKRRNRSPRIRPFANPLGIVELECSKGCQATSGGTFSALQDDGADLGRGTSTVSVPLTWKTKLLAFDGDGPIYIDAHCPECGQRGRRATITARDLDNNLINDQEIAEIGQERIYTFLFLITQMFDPDDPRPEKQLYPLLTTEFIAKHTCQRAVDVDRHIKELHQIKWLDVAFVSPSKYKIAFGKPWASWDKGAARENEADRLAEQGD